jgi:chemotaxis protein MotB
MKTSTANIKIFSLVILLSQACVPPAFFSEVETERDNCKNEREELFTENEHLTVDNTELKADLEIAAKEKKRIEEQGLANAEELKILKGRYSQLDDRYEELKQAHNALLSGSDAETRNLMERLENTQKDLYQREDQLNQMQANLDKDREDLSILQRELQQKNTRLIELEQVLNKKDAEAENLKQKLSTALMGFENQGLTITKKNGKVYVSLEEQLLFASGSTEVDPRGKNALKKLANVLEQNPDIKIMIEGHTDDVPVIPGAKFADNWDLSVQRATAIIRILLDGTSINPTRLTAAGRGEFLPVDPGKTAEARQKNRRTEIILAPDLDEVFELLEQDR